MEGLKPHAALAPFSLRDLLRYALVFASYFLVATLFLYLYYGLKTSPALIWPPVGLAVIAMIYGGYRMWLPILLAQYSALILYNPQVHTLALVVAVGCALQAVAALYALRYFKFEPFFQIERGRTTSEGLGIGLALAKDIITLHGGSIEATSDGYGKGSEFLVRIPLQ